MPYKSFEHKFNLGDLVKFKCGGFYNYVVAEIHGVVVSEYIAKTMYCLREPKGDLFCCHEHELEAVVPLDKKETQTDDVDNNTNESTN